MILISVANIIFLYCLLFSREHLPTLHVIFSKMNFGQMGVYILSSISRALHFSTGFFSMYRGILELKNDSRILRKNSSFKNETCFGLTALFVKTKIYFYRCNFANKQQTKIPVLFVNRKNPKYSRKCF